MNRKSTRPYLYFIGALLLLMSIPKQTVEKSRGLTVAMIAPFWEILATAHTSAQTLVRNETPNLEELENLKLQNDLLKKEIEKLNELLHYRNAKLPTAFPARVIYRSPSTWYSSLWINIGAADHPSLAKNSPVLVGSSVVGVIDYVGANQSRVRLITDSGLTPSVRSVRGQLQTRIALENLLRLYFYIQNHPEIPNQVTSLHHLAQLRKDVSNNEPALALAKGELRGSSKPLWRGKGNLLKGIGFNYDFADEQGPARDLRTGEALGSNAPTLPLLKVNDLLITTGMDGVFPPGLRVAEITKINLLKEGDYYYTLEAKPTAGNLDDLTLVFVIPPLGYDSTDQPSRIGD